MQTKKEERQADQAEHRQIIKTEYKESLANIQANKVKNQPKQQRQPSKYEIERDERKAVKVALANTRGKELGYVPIAYIGGYDDQKRVSAKLRFYENQIEYSSFKQPVKGLVIEAPDVKSIEIGGQSQTTSRLSVTRMATLGVFSLAAPKRSSIKDTTVTIGLKNGRQVFFHTKMYTEFEVHTKLANAISHYHQLQTTQDNQQVVASPTAETDNTAEIMKYATLLKRGVITQEEYQVKKRQLLGL